MKLRDIDKDKMLKLLECIHVLNLADREISELTNPNQYGEGYDDAWWFLDYYNVLNIVYFEFVGLPYKETYDLFSASVYDKSDKPVAWYRDETHQGVPYLPGPGQYKGYIPDCITEVVLNKDLDGRAKLELLERMFSDLDRAFRVRDLCNEVQA